MSELVLSLLIIAGIVVAIVGGWYLPMWVARILDRWFE